MITQNSPDTYPLILSKLLSLSRTKYDFGLGISKIEESHFSNTIRMLQNNRT
ncbi:hypothetical protein acsn021_43970 [Anaerocolumna cellulosilytica]|uniref:Uncharacterized protein n=1 Tax=Anaerocolumna cellulosilytica TaxID=433286 RepID=A0A6S6RDE4_9FIRM|nr:hypothetical protein acsn021_43970 [Anaerocolumna cellulosilytica]